MIRALVVADTEPPPFSTLLVVWKLTPQRAATSLTETCLVGLPTLTLRVLCAGKRTFACAKSVGGKWSLGPRPEYPRPNLRRPKWMSLNGEWELGVGDRPAYDRRILVPFCPESALSGIGERVGDVLWYRTRFDAPAAERLHLHFGAVDYWATVWVNDVEVARHEGGHSPFTADITSAVRRRDNVLVVRAEDSLADKTLPRGKQFWTEMPEGIFYTATTGIWQPVWLEPMPERHIRGLRLMPDLGEGALHCIASVDGHAEVTVRLEGDIVGRWSGEVWPATIRLDSIAPWTPDAPRLYDVDVRAGDDRVESYFGLRKFHLREGRCWLNDEPFIQRFVPDPGYFPGGLLTAASDAPLRRDTALPT